MTEHSFKNRVMARLKSIPGLYAVKRHGGAFGKRGEPDITGCFDGVRFEMELKQEGENPDPLQWLELRKWAMAGAVSAVVRNTADLEILLYRLISKKRGDRGCVTCKRCGDWMVWDRIKKAFECEGCEERWSL